MLWTREVWVLIGDLSRLVLPTGCASCGAATGRARVLRGPGQLELLVPYCSTCLERGARYDTLSIAVATASILLCSCFALAFPMLWPDATLAVHLAATSCAAVAPMVWASLVTSSAALPSGRPSLWWRWNGRLACDYRPFAEELARLNGLAVRRARAACACAHRTWLWAPLLGLVLAPGMYLWHHPQLRVLNLSGQPLWLVIDDTRRVALTPSSAESPASGLTLRVPRGSRRLAALDVGGGVVAAARVELTSRHDHLYAPASDGHCFWLELTGYGRERGRRVVPLASPLRFWTLDTAVDTWFVPSPEPRGEDEWSSGGTLTSLRHARCAEAPAPVREPVSAIGP